jgi:chromate transporter
LRGLGLSPGVALFEAFYHSGALVFGGRHVVLPLLREAFVTSGWVRDDVFLGGYGAAQAVQGPLFTFAAYLGYVVSPSPHGAVGAALGADRHFSSRCADPSGRCRSGKPSASAPGRKRYARCERCRYGFARCGALQPGLDQFSRSAGDFAIALIGFVLLIAWRAPPLLVVVICALGGATLAIAR